MNDQEFALFRELVGNAPVVLVLLGLLLWQSREYTRQIAIERTRYDQALALERERYDRLWEVVIRLTVNDQQPLTPTTIHQTP